MEVYKFKNYITTRIEQLKEDKEKASDPHDILWYNRCIQELDWALQMSSKPSQNCYMSSRNDVSEILSKHLSGMN